MSNTVFNNHPMIKNSNQYFLEKKYVSIHSEDRDITKFPSSNEFEIMLPQEYLNIVSAKLYSWSFPANYNVFSLLDHNVVISFKLTELYNPGEHYYNDILSEGIFAALYSFKDKEIITAIEPGFYNPDQMATELTNKFNTAVTNKIDTFFNNPDNIVKYAAVKALFEASGGYNRFVIVYNSVTQKLSFGNNADRFILTNNAGIYFSKVLVNTNCYRRNQLPESISWGLPSYLGFNRCDATAYTVKEYIDKISGTNSIDVIPEISGTVPRFYYGDAVSGSGDGGFWLLPTLPGSDVYFLEAPFKISFMGQAYIYMEVDGWNCIDETSPYNFCTYTSQTNQTNGIVNSAFAKIPVPTTPISQWFDNDMGPYKYWNPPAERINKIKFKFRYHNGAPVEFGQFEYSFMIELNLLKPQQERSYSIRNSFDLAQQNSFSSNFI